MTARFARCLRHAVTALVVYVMFSPSEASAKFFMITTGETISDVRSGKDGNKSVKIGYKYDYAGLFWIDFWTWDGGYCVYEGTNFRPITAEQAAQLLGKSPREISPPFLYRFPLGLLIVAGFVLLAVIGKVVNKKGDGGTTPAAPDDSYQR